jgi:hypothetical protein
VNHAQGHQHTAGGAVDCGNDTVVKRELATSRPCFGSTDEATMRYFILMVALLLDPAAGLLLAASKR